MHLVYVFLAYMCFAHINIIQMSDGKEVDNKLLNYENYIDRTNDFWGLTIHCLHYYHVTFVLSYWQQTLIWHQQIDYV